jgi:predicted transcriptional regulator
VILAGGYDFNDYMKRLEKQGYLKYRNGKWEATDKALDYIEKYHGD